MAQEQIMTAAEEAEADAFETMMSALDVFFHVAMCPNHSREERQDALKDAKEAFAAFVGYDPLTGPDDQEEEEALPPSDELGVDVALPRANAPTSNKVH